MTPHNRRMANLRRRRVGQYKLGRRLGRGHFATVFLGRHILLRRKAAVKMLHAELLHEQARQFYIEAYIIANLVHPNIVRVLDFAVENGVPFLVMDYAPNGTLRQRHLAGTRLPLTIIVSYIKQVAAALQYAHNKGGVHRDVKPGNMLLGRNNEVLLSDFGIAVRVPQLDSPVIHDAVGTPLYMAPEQINGHPCKASDQYSLAVVAFEWLTGTPPFTGTIAEEIASQHLHSPLPSLRVRVPSIPLAVERVIRKALSKDPEDRFSSVSAFAAALEEASELTVDEEQHVPLVPHQMGISQQPGGPRRAGSPQQAGRDRHPSIRSLITTLSLALFAFLIIFFTVIFPGISLATVLITPERADLEDTYAFSAVTGNADPSQRQVKARFISFPTPPQSVTAIATGMRHTPATQATGLLTFFNALTFPQTIAAAIALTSSTGVQIINDAAITIPASNPPTEGSMTVAAHAIQAGTASNIGALAINQPCCLTGITVENKAPFTGGQDAQDFTVVQQSDIDRAAQPLEIVLTADAQKSLQAQVRSNEQLFGSPQCRPDVASDPTVGDKAQVVEVTVTVRCTAEVYDKQAAQSIVIGLLKEEARKKPGPGYLVIGMVVTSVIQEKLIDAKKGLISLQIRAAGVWGFQFSDEQKQTILNLIIGKSREEANDLLQKEPGVVSVDIQIFYGDTLPANARQVRLIILYPPPAAGVLPACTIKPAI